MEDLPAEGFFRSLIGLFNITSKITSIEHDIAEVHKVMRYTVTCDKIVEGIHLQLADIKDIGAETRGDVKELLKRGE